MAAPETIRRENSLGLWNALTQDGTVLRLRPPDKSREWIAVAAAVRTRRNKLYLGISDNDQLRAALVDAPDTRMVLEFTDRNKVPHACEIEHFRLTDSEIWLQIPATIERYQRREIFRLEAPSGSELSLTIEGVDYRLLLIDVSINGAKGLLSHLNPKREPPLIGHQGQRIANAVLIFATKSGAQRIHIAECTIRRLETHAPTGKMQCALEFTRIDERNEQLLTKMIYEFQREYLRRRHRTR